MKAVRETIDGMEQIRQSVVESNAVVSRLGERSVAIGKILNVIEDVAEQTNLLALNAAILAAQAGEYGKGFSVVAAEIRDLSERTASSTRDIANLIRSVQEEVDNALKAMSRRLEARRGRRVALARGGQGAEQHPRVGDEVLGHGQGDRRRHARAGQGQRDRHARRSTGCRRWSARSTPRRRSRRRARITSCKAVESMREVTKYVRQAMVEQKSGSAMISAAAERMIEMIHEIFQVAANQASESEKIVATMQQVRAIADGNRNSRWRWAIADAAHRRHPRTRRRNAQVPRARMMALRGASPGAAAARSFTSIIRRFRMCMDFAGADWRAKREFHVTLAGTTTMRLLVPMMPDDVIKRAAQLLTFTHHASRCISGTCAKRKRRPSSACATSPAPKSFSPDSKAICRFHRASSVSRHALHHRHAARHRRCHPRRAERLGEPIAGPERDALLSVIQ